MKKINLFIKFLVALTLEMLVLFIDSQWVLLISFVLIAIFGFFVARANNGNIKTVLKSGLSVLLFIIMLDLTIVFYRFFFSFQKWNNSIVILIPTYILESLLIIVGVIIGGLLGKLFYSKKFNI